MPSRRKQKLRANAGVSKQRERRRLFDEERCKWYWLTPAAIGREFGSPDFARLMKEDQQRGTGVFDPALKSMFANRS